ncbi:MAG: cobyrinate a,c-diamide synthase [Chloroflexi bacterium]|nr:cobyrinate a,c-diamide synthase [Chloroflexota bacterium]
MSTSRQIPRLIIAGVSSGVGKTTIATGIMGALRRRGFKIQPFKAGPDYIDPSYHSRIADATSRNLDPWMLPGASLLELYLHAVEKADIAIIEGVMGLFDGRSGHEETGSTAELAKLLRSPVLLVIDISKMARSAAAVVLGYLNFDPELRLAGVILNQVGSESHRRWVTEAIEKATRIPVVGYLPRQEELVLPERHLGLIPTTEGDAWDEFLERLIQQVTKTINLREVVRIARSAEPLPAITTGLFTKEQPERQVSIAVAQDEAFSFYYQDNLDLLSAWGARLLPFSPLHDPALPSDISGVYIGGGFPELYAAGLSANRSMQHSIKMAVAAGMPIYAECGGLMYLSQGIVDFEGRRYEMVGAIPSQTLMRQRRMRLGYVTVRARRDTPLLQRGDTVRGHEFHWSELEKNIAKTEAAYDVLDDRPGRMEGYSRGHLLASYVHLHFGSNPALAPNFIASCARWAEKGTA